MESKEKHLKNEGALKKNRTNTLPQLEDIDGALEGSVGNFLNRQLVGQADPKSSYNSYGVMPFTVEHNAKHHPSKLLEANPERCTKSHAIHRNTGEDLLLKRTRRSAFESSNTDTESATIYV